MAEVPLMCGLEVLQIADECCGGAADSGRHPGDAIDSAISGASYRAGRGMLLIAAAVLGLPWIANLVECYG